MIHLPVIGYQSSTHTYLLRAYYLQATLLEAVYIKILRQMQTIKLIQTKTPAYKKEMHNTYWGKMTTKYNVRYQNVKIPR